MAAIAVTILTAAATAAVSSAAVKGVDAAIALIGDASDWTSARETFTQTTVQTMFDARPSGYVAAACYNMAYEVSDKSLISEVTSVELKTGSLHTDYDCFFLAPGADLYTLGDGGYINLATYSESSCSFSSDAADLYC